MAIEGKTYSLFDGTGDSERYYETIKELADLFLKSVPDENRLLTLLKGAGKGRSICNLLIRPGEAGIIRFIRERLKDSLSIHTRKVGEHLKSLSSRQRLDDTLATKEEQYHLYMLEIELVNRIYLTRFKRGEYKFALIAHCLRDFRPNCRSEPGDIESVCKGCTKECHINLASVLLKRYGIDPYISVEIEQKKLFTKIKREHPSAGALGIACVPELAMGMRLCISQNIPPIGIPLDANRCRRWMGEAHETSFNISQLDKLLE
jgi:hypothetical protein